MKVLFRTAGGAAEKHELGTGHIFRCVNLAKGLKKCEIVFAVEDYGGIKEIFKNHNFHNVHYFGPDITKKNDLKKTNEIIKKEKIDILIVDKLGTKKSYLREIKKNITTIYIADLLEYDYPADLVINGFVGLKNSKTINKYGSKCLIGPKYQILSNTPIQKIPKKPKFDLLITLGGYDKNCNLDNLAEILPKYLLKLRIKIIVGPSTKKPEKIIELKKKFKKSLEITKYSKNMINEIINSKFGLCGGGITTYEFALFKIPFLIICQYDHQITTARYWKKFGYSYDYVLPKDKTMRKIESYLQNIIEQKIISKKKKFEIDNLGISRIVKEIHELKTT